jgi:hypothetical protein
VAARVPTRPGARNGVAGTDGTVYLAHTSSSKLNEITVVAPSGL